MDIKKIKEIADRHNLDIVDKQDCILINSYRNQERYKMFNTITNDSQKAFYTEFMDELIKNIRTKNLFNEIMRDPKGYSDLFKDLSFLTEEYGKLFEI